VIFMKNNPLLSIIINCFNSDKYLRETIDSLIAQTYENWEIIFWDNQSIDSSADIAKSYSDSRIKYFLAPEHTSLGEGRNHALSKVSGDIVSFLDADDYYLPERLRNIVNSFNDNDKVDFIYTNGFRLNQNTKIKTPFYDIKQKSGNLFQSWLKNYNVMIPSVAFKSELLLEMHELVDVRFSMIEEYDFFLRMIKDKNVKYLDDKSCIWRCHSESLTWKENKNWSVELEMFLIKLQDIYPNDKLELSTLQKKIAISKYIYGLTNNKNERNILIKYVFKSYKVFFLYMLSFFGFRLTRLVVNRIIF
jgi:glycosyltransferase involved in cell wall biosynthesis